MRQLTPSAPSAEAKHAIITTTKMATPNNYSAGEQINRISLATESRSEDGGSSAVATDSEMRVPCVSSSGGVARVSGDATLTSTPDVGGHGGVASVGTNMASTPANNVPPYNYNKKPNMSSFKITNVLPSRPPSDGHDDDSGDDESGSLPISTLSHNNSRTMVAKLEEPSVLAAVWLGCPISGYFSVLKSSSSKGSVRQGLRRGSRSPPQVTYLGDMPPTRRSSTCDELFNNLSTNNISANAANVSQKMCQGQAASAFSSAKNGSSDKPSLIMSQTKQRIPAKHTMSGSMLLSLVYRNFASNAFVSVINSELAAVKPPSATGTPSSASSSPVQENSSTVNTSTSSSALPKDRFKVVKVESDVSVRVDYDRWHFLNFEDRVAAHSSHAARSQSAYFQMGTRPAHRISKEDSRHTSQSSVKAARNKAANQPHPSQQHHIQQQQQQQQPQQPVQSTNVAVKSTAPSDQTVTKSSVAAESVRELTKLNNVLQGQLEDVKRHTSAQSAVVVNSNKLLAAEQSLSELIEMNKALLRESSAASQSESTVANVAKSGPQSASTNPANAQSKSGVNTPHHSSTAAAKKTATPATNGRTTSTPGGTAHSASHVTSSSTAAAAASAASTAASASITNKRSVVRAVTPASSNVRVPTTTVVTQNTATPEVGHEADAFSSMIDNDKLMRRLEEISSSRQMMEAAAPDRVVPYTPTTISPSSGPSAIDSRIEQAMDLVKAHLMSAVRGEIEELKDKIIKLEDKLAASQAENEFLRAQAAPEVLARLSAVHARVQAAAAAAGANAGAANSPSAVDSPRHRASVANNASTSSPSQMQTPPVAQHHHQQQQSQQQH